MPPRPVLGLFRSCQPRTLDPVFCSSSFILPCFSHILCLSISVSTSHRYSSRRWVGQCARDTGSRLPLTWQVSPASRHSLSCWQCWAWHSSLAGVLLRQRVRQVRWPPGPHPGHSAPLSSTRRSSAPGGDRFRQVGTAALWSPGSGTRPMLPFKPNSVGQWQSGVLPLGHLLLARWPCWRWTSQTPPDDFLGSCGKSLAHHPVGDALGSRHHLAQPKNRPAEAMVFDRSTPLPPVPFSSVPQLLCGPSRPVFFQTRDTVGVRPGHVVLLAGVLWRGRTEAGASSTAASARLSVLAAMGARQTGIGMRRCFPVTAPHRLQLPSR